MVPNLTPRSRGARALTATQGLVETRSRHQNKERPTRANSMISPIRAAKRFGPRLAIAISLAASPGCLSIDTDVEGVAFLAVVSGNNQDLQVGSTNAVPLVVRAFDNATQPMGDVEVTWAVNPSSGGTVSTASTTTDDAGFAQVNFTPGSTPQTVLVRATADGLTVSFTINIVAASG